MCPADYPYLYSKDEYTKLYLGEKYHWRQVSESLVTFMTSKQLIEQHYDNLEKMSTSELLQKINNEDKKVSIAVRKVIPKIKEAVEIIVKKINEGGRLFYIGAGTSGRIGILDASDNKDNAERFMTFMTSKVAQQYFATQVHEYPLITDGVTPNRLLEDMESLSKPDIDISQLGDLENTQALLIEVGALQ